MGRAHAGSILSYDESGAVLVFHGSATGASTTADETLTGKYGYGSYFGTSLSAAGDVNGDGLADVIAGAPGKGKGSAYLFEGYGDVDGDGTVSSDDCDDNDPSRHPGATEIVGDSIDQNCDFGEICYVDADADGFTTDGIATIPSSDADCDDPGEAGATTPTGDCDDASAAFHPGADESACDGVDYDCDGAVPDDVDHDGWFACADCDDEQPGVHPGAPETCDGRDDDCDGTTDVDAVDAATWSADADGDGATDPATHVTACDPPEGFIAAAADDCDDADAARAPGLVDVPGDGLDQDCDGADAIGSDEPAKTGCSCATPGVHGGGLGALVLATLLLRRRARR